MNEMSERRENNIIGAVIITVKWNKMHASKSDHFKTEMYIDSMDYLKEFICNN